MKRHADWAYVQARLQARHGERLGPSDWAALDAAKSLEHFIERARASSLRRFADHLNARMSSHAIERALRAAWRSFVGEVASWAPERWRPAVRWVAFVPDLQVLQHLLSGDTPPWTHADPVYAPLAEAEPGRRLERLGETPLRPLAALHDPAAPIAARWLAHWRALWPPQSASDRAPLDRLVAIVGAHRDRLARAGAQDSSDRTRAELAQSVARLFRRHSATPAALFSELILIALDLERLRGGLVRRRLFAEPAKEAA